MQMVADRLVNESVVVMVQELREALRQRLRSLGA